MGSVEGLAYHRAWDTLYWSSTTTSTITRKTVDQTQVGAFPRQAVVTLSEEDHPHVLALDECQKSVALSSAYFSNQCFKMLDLLLNPKTQISDFTGDVMHCFAVFLDV